jgi:hypothetical protein
MSGPPHGYNYSGAPYDPYNSQWRMMPAETQHSYVTDNRYGSYHPQLMVPGPYAGPPRLEPPTSYDNASACSKATSSQVLPASATAVPKKKGPIATLLESKRAAAAAAVTVTAATPAVQQTISTSVKVGRKDGDDQREGPRMSSNLERHVHVALSIIFVGKAFEKIRPSWLRNPRTGRMCELDFYNDELKLGVECQGLQHYVYPNSWHKTRSEWEEQIHRDQLKAQLCQKTGVTLLHVPFTVPLNKMEQFLREEIRRVTPVGLSLHTWLQHDS